MAEVQGERREVAFNILADIVDPHLDMYQAGLDHLVASAAGIDASGRHRVFPRIIKARSDIRSSNLTSDERDGILAIAIGRLADLALEGHTVYSVWRYPP